MSANVLTEATGLSDTERDNLAGFLRWVRDSSAWSSPSDIAEPSAELCEHVDALIADRVQAATLAERERLLGVIAGRADHIHECAQAVVNRDDRSLGLKSGYQQSASALRALIAQERAR